MLKILLIEDNPAYGQLFRHHLTTEWPEAYIVERSPALVGPLPAEMVGAAFDVVLVDHDLKAGPGFPVVLELSQRPGFPPIVYLSPTTEDAYALPALRAGAEACVGKTKVDHRRFISTVSEAARKRKRQLALMRGTSQARQAYRFGNITIRGQRFIRMIATGPLATLYLAESERIGELIALKVFSEVPDKTEGKSTFDRFLQEYEVVSKVEHPNVVRIYDLGVADDHAYIAMEYFTSGDLKQKMKAGAIPPATALDYLRQMARALEAIHAVGVLHRDLKPGNVMLREDGTLALIDFGLAKQLKLDMEITGTGEIFGTPYYMSPEQGHGSDTDERSDVYSLGVIFYELLTGRKPYLASTPMAVIYKHSHAPIPALPADLSHLQGLVNRLLAKTPQDRYQSAMALIHAMDALPAQAPPLAAAAV